MARWQSQNAELAHLERAMSTRHGVPVIVGQPPPGIMDDPPELVAVTSRGLHALSAVPRWRRMLFYGLRAMASATAKVAR